MSYMYIVRKSTSSTTRLQNTYIENIKQSNER